MGADGSGMGSGLDLEGPGTGGVSGADGGRVGSGADADGAGVDVVGGGACAGLDPCRDRPGHAVRPSGRSLRTFAEPAVSCANPRPTPGEGRTQPRPGPETGRTQPRPRPGESSTQPGEEPAQGGAWPSVRPIRGDRSGAPLCGLRIFGRSPERSGIHCPEMERMPDHRRTVSVMVGRIWLPGRMGKQVVLCRRLGFGCLRLRKQCGHGHPSQRNGTLRPTCSHRGRTQRYAGITRV